MKSIINVEPYIDRTCLEKFAHLMDSKLKVARENGRGGWHDKDACRIEHLRMCLQEQLHKSKLDYVDIAIFCMMIHFREQVAKPNEEENEK